MRLLALVAFLFLATPAYATTTYSYAGSTFTIVDGPFTTEMSLNFSITLESPLAGGLNSFDIGPSIVSFSGSNGVLLFTSLDDTQSELLVTTDLSGSIVEWSIGFFDISVQGLMTCHIISSFICATLPSGILTGDAAGAGVGSAQVYNNPGVWSIIPEASSASLLALGLICITVKRRTARSL